MDLQYLFLVFRARLGWIVLCGLLFAAIGLGTGLLLHRRAATATLLVVSPLVETDGAARNGPPPAAQSSALDVLSSPRVVQRVIDTLHLTPETPQVRAWGRIGEGDTVSEWMTTRLLKDVRFGATPDSSIVTITAYSRDANFAKALANAFAQAYQAVSRDVQAQQAGSRATQLEQGLPSTEADLHAARAAMTQFRQAHPGFNPDDRNSSSGGTVAALATQLAQAQSEVPSPDATRNFQDPALQALQSEARRARAHWLEISAKYGINHPAYADAASEMKQAQQALQAAAASAWQANARKIGSLRAALKRQQDEAVDESALQEEYSAFQRSVAAAETSVNTTRTSLRRARVERDTARGTAAVFSSAMLQPAGASDPWRRALPLGGAIGLLLGSMFALLLEEWSPRVRGSRSTIAALGARLLTRVPAADAPRRIVNALARASERNGETPESGSGTAVEHQLLREHALGRIVAPEQLVAPATSQRLATAGGMRERGFAGERRRDGCATREPQSSPSFVVDLNPSHPVAEAVRELRSNVLLEWRHSGQRRPVCLLGLHHGDGRTFLACNLAIAFAQANLRTLLVDLDLRTPGLHKLFGLQAGLGVAGLLMGQQVRPHTVDSRGLLDVLPAGPRVPNPQELVSGAALGELLHDLNERYDAVVVDGPAWSCGADGQLIASAGVDVVLLARTDHTPLRRLQEMRERLIDLEVRVLGVVTSEH
jgi:capsular exopolysaccharide synthesis family protein